MDFAPLKLQDLEISATVIGMADYFAGNFITVIE